MLIGLHCDALNVYPRGRSILMIERFLRLDETAGLFGDDPRVGVPGLMQVDSTRCLRPSHTSSGYWQMIGS